MNQTDCWPNKEGQLFKWNRDGEICRVTGVRDSGIQVWYTIESGPRRGNRQYTELPQDLSWVTESELEARLEADRQILRMTRRQTLVYKPDPIIQSGPVVAIKNEGAEDSPARRIELAEIEFEAAEEAFNQAKERCIRAAKILEELKRDLADLE